MTAPMQELPELRVEGDHYIVEWAGLRAEYTHLNEIRGAQFGGLNGEVRITATLPGLPGHLHEARMNLSSTSSRETLIKTLQKRIAADAGLVPVEDFVEMACVLVIRRFRQGSPLVNLAEVEYKPAAFSVEHLFPLNKRNQLYAPAENLKSTLAMAFLMDIATGNDQDTGKASLGFSVNGGPVGYIDWEMDENDSSNIWHRLAQGRGLETVPDIFYRRCHRPLWEEAESLEPQFRREGVVAVAIDSAFWASGNNPNNQDNVGLMFQGMDALGDLTTILLNHTGADQADKKRRRSYGLEHFRNSVRASWELRKAETPGDPYIHLGLYRDKLNIRKSASGPYGFRVKFEGDEGPITVERDDSDIDETPELEESKASPERVRAYLLKHGRTAASVLVEELRLNETNVYTAISRLGKAVMKEKAGRIVYYSIPTDRMEEGNLT